MTTTVTTTSHVELRLTRATPGPVTIGATGTITTTDPFAVYGEHPVAWSLVNLGLLSGGRLGVTLATGGQVNNAGTLQGGLGGLAIGRGAGTVTNAGLLRGLGSAGYGVRLLLGGSVDNADGGVIQGGAEGIDIRTAAGVVTNAGSIGATGANGIGVLLETGGVVSNGPGDSAAAITGVSAGVSVHGTATVANVATIRASAGSGVYGAVAVTVFNGDPDAPRALISGGTYGVRLVAAGGATDTLVNDGTIAGASGAGAYLNGPSVVFNGGAGATAALAIGGHYGVFIRGPGYVVNYGTIAGTGGLRAHYTFPPDMAPPPPGPPPGSFGVDLSSGGAMRNGSASDTSALLYGSFLGLQVHGGRANVHNYGTIAGGLCGVYTWVGGTVVNGSLADRTALIAGRILGTWNTYPGGTVINYATIASTGGSGVGLGSGGHPGAAGIVVNGSADDTVATIIGAINGVTTVNQAIVENYGSLLGASGVGCYVTAGGALVNGSHADRVARIEGAVAGAVLRGAVMTLSNDGTITGAGMGAALDTGGTVRNGLGGVPTAIISGGSGAGVYVHAAAGTVINHATITSTGGAGVALQTGGRVVNGHAGLHHAVISGAEGVLVLGGGGLVANHGTIRATDGSGVELAAGGVAHNGLGGGGALIAGTTYGLFAHGAAAVSVVNDGTVEALPAGGVGLYLQGGGTLRNGLPADQGATVAGGLDGVRVNHGAAIANFGTIAGTSRYGIELILGGTIVNGSTRDHAALISGGVLGVYLKGDRGQVVNQGRILSDGRAVYLQAGGTVLNQGTIAGATGVGFGAGDATVVNAGLIQGSDGVALRFGAGVDTLVLDPGAAFGGVVDGRAGHSTLELAAGSGSAGGLGSAFTGFAGVRVDAGATWSLSGANSIAALLDQGTLLLAPGARLAVSGAVDPAGGGTIGLGAGAALELAAPPGIGTAIAFLGSAELIVDAAPPVGGVLALCVRGFGAGDRLDVRGLALAGATLGYDPASGVLQLAAGGGPPAGPGAFHLSDDGTGHALVTLG